MDRIGHPAHVSVAAREAAIGLPVALGYLITIVYVHPSEPQFLHFVQRADDLVHGEQSLVSPRAPYGLKRLILRRCGRHTVVALHHFGKSTQAGEEIARVVIAKSGKGM